MRSFAITAFATLAFGLFCSAAPTPDGSGDVNVSRDLVDVGVDLDLDLLGLVDDADVRLSRRLVDAVVDADVLGLIHADVDLNIRSTPANNKCLDGIINGAVADIAVIVDEISESSRSSFILSPVADSTPA